MFNLPPSTTKGLGPRLQLPLGQTLVFGALVMAFVKRTSLVPVMLNTTDSFSGAMSRSEVISSYKKDEKEGYVRSHRNYLHRNIYTKEYFTYFSLNNHVFGSDSYLVICRKQQLS